MKGVIIVHPSEKLAQQLKRELSLCGLEILALCAKGSTLLNMADTVGAAVVICPLFLPDMTAYHLAEALPATFDIIALAKTAEAESTHSNLSVLRLPLQREEFLHLAMRLCQPSIHAPQGKARTAQECAYIAEAKQILMREHGCSEAQAHRYLQRWAMSHGLKLSHAALQIMHDRRQ